MAKTPAPITTPESAAPGAGATESSVASAPGEPAVVPSGPPAGGSYTLDPATGLLTCAVESTQERPPMRKVQDPVTGAITKTVIQE